MSWITFVWVGFAFWCASRFISALSGANARNHELRRLEIESRGLPSEVEDTFRTEIDDLREELAEVHERLDFTERVLAQNRAAAALPEPIATPTPPTD